MFARISTIPLKANTGSEYAKTIEKAVLPQLRAQKGFLDEIALVSADGKTGFGISFWDSKESAEAYSRSAFNQVVKALELVAAGSAQGQVCEVTNSTAHKIAAAVAA